MSEHGATINRDNEKEFDYADLLPALDVKDGLGRLMNNKKVYFKVLNNFASQQMVDELITSMNQDDFAKIAQAAHALKGVSANLGLTELTKTAADIEARAKSETKASELIPSLDEVVKAAMQAIDTLLGREGVK